MAQNSLQSMIQKACMRQLKNSGIQTATASQLRDKWLKIVQDELRKAIKKYDYKPTPPKVYHRTGDIFNHIQATVDDESSGTVSYTHYPSVSFVTGGPNGENVMRLVENGYVTYAHVPWRDTPWAGVREGGHAMQHVVDSLKARAAAEGVAITIE